MDEMKLWVKVCCVAATGVVRDGMVECILSP